MRADNPFAQKQLTKISKMGESKMTALKCALIALFHQAELIVKLFAQVAFYVLCDALYELVCHLLIVSGLTKISKMGESKMTALKCADDAKWNERFGSKKQEFAASEAVPAGEEERRSSFPCPLL